VTDSNERRTAGRPTGLLWLVTVVLTKRRLVAWRNEARELALRDPLTGANRRALTDAMHELPRPLALVMIDLDNFKLANTLYGHVGGDRVLCLVADVLRSVTGKDRWITSWEADLHVHVHVT